MPNWTFASATFTWLRAGGGNVSTLPTWRRQPRRVERMIVGTGETEINYIGFTPYRITGQVWASAAAFALLEAAQGTSGTVSDGTRSCTAELQLDLDTMAPGDDDGYTGTLTFTLPIPQDYDTLPRPF